MLSVRAEVMRYSIVRMGHHSSACIAQQLSWTIALAARWACFAHACGPAEARGGARLGDQAEPGLDPAHLLAVGQRVDALHVRVGQRLRLRRAGAAGAALRRQRRREAGLQLLHVHRLAPAMCACRVMVILGAQVLLPVVDSGCGQYLDSPGRFHHAGLHREQ